MRGLPLCICLVAALLPMRGAQAQRDSASVAADLQTLVLREIGLPRRDVVCLGVADRINAPADPRQMLDPDSVLLSRLEWMRNLRVSSACELIPDPHQAVFSRADHKRGVHVGISTPQFADDRHATIDVQIFWGGLEGETDRCELVRNERDWRVRSCRRIGIY